MIHTFIGNLGHFSVILAFVSSLVAGFAFYKATTDKLDAKGWLGYARVAFYIHAVSVISVVACLYYIVYNHYFEYHWVWYHTSSTMPMRYLLSAFWEGQEGSFLLWTFWHVVIGNVLIFTAKAYLF